MIGWSRRHLLLSVGALLGCLCLLLPSPLLHPSLPALTAVSASRPPPAATASGSSQTATAGGSTEPTGSSPLQVVDPADPSTWRCRPGLYKGRFPPCPALLQVLIPSRAQPNNIPRREIIRYNLQRSFDASRFSLAYYFLVSFNGDPGAWEGLLAENATHGDIFLAPLDRTKATPELISDSDMVKKVWHEMADATAVGAARGWQPRYWAKFDDDVTVLWDRFLPVLDKDMPREGLLWCAQGTGAYAGKGGYSGLYCNGPYLLSIGVVNKIASDARQASVEDLYAGDTSKVWEYNDG
jgi:hypothetical protein